MNSKKTTKGIVIPTYNGGELWKQVVNALKTQRTNLDKILVIDSGSSDNTVQISKEANFDVIIISHSDFNHGATRNLGLTRIDCDIVVFFTQDAIPQEKAIAKIVCAFDDSSIAVAYGRQLPHDDATPIAKHARLFNYKNTSHVYGIEDKKQYGIKTVFTSNSFAAYRTEYFKKIGGFPDKNIFAEDMYFTAKAVLSDYKVAYVAEAVVKHSHNYSPMQEFKRSFDTGVFHREESSIIALFGKAEGEGFRFVLSELSFLWKNGKLFWIPKAFINNLFKILGYKFGLNYKKIPNKLIVRFSMNKNYWI
jgi:rhamnosyltransferase